MPSETIEKFLRAQRKELTVPRGSEMIIDPAKDETARDLHPLEMRTFEDLQALRLVAPELNEKAVRDAIAADDEDAWQTAMRMVESGKAHCGCKDRYAESGAGDEAEHSSTNPQRSLQSAYRALRRRRHPHLARVITGELNNTVESDNPAPSLTHAWVTGLDRAKVVTGLGLHYLNVTINHNATLLLASGINVFFCGDLRIHLGGRLRIKNSYIKVNCLSVQGNIP